MSPGEGVSVREATAGASNVLVTSPAMESATDEVCADLFATSGEERALFVTLADAPDDRLAALRAHADGTDPERVGFVAADDSARSTSGTTVECQGTRIRIETVSSPGDLTGLGIETSSFLARWGDDRPIRVCFHSLTTLLQYVDVERAFRFLHVLTGRFDEAGARAHFHLDPGAHEPREVNTLKPLFDAVVAFEDGEWTARTR